jgi:hypothetical protein
MTVLAFLEGLGWMTGGRRSTSVGGFFDGFIVYLLSDRIDP